MGGCVMSVMCMNSSHEKSLIQHPGIKKFRAEPNFNVLVSEPEGEFSGIYRSSAEKDMDQATAYKKFYEDNVVTRLEAACKVNKGNAVGWRPLDHIEPCTIVENGKDKKWEYLHLKATEYYTFPQLWAKMLAFGRGLREMGVPAGAKIGIYEDTRVEWIVSIFGMWTQGMTGVTVYASLGDDALDYAINEAELDYIICNGKLVKNLVKVVSHEKIPKIIYLDEIPTGHDIGSATTFRFEDIMAKGEAVSAETYPLVTPKPDDIAVIMYTSGTTGDPKGVVMSHGNVTAASSSVAPRLYSFCEDMPSKDLAYVAYLPLAHILEFLAEIVLLIHGAFVGFGTPRTLTNVSAKPHGDLAEFRPVLMIGVPRVFDTIKKVVESRIPGGIKGQIFRKAYDERLDCLKKGLETPYFNEKVFSLVRDTLGGRCVGILSGGSPMSPKAQEFMTVVSGATVVQGYGLTETSCIVSIQMAWDTRSEEVGTILAGAEVRLKDVEDWKHTDPEPRGEILVRGPANTKGYYKQPELTAESYDSEGWFHTGDIGMMTKEGTLRVVGRVKALAKNTNGEYIALETLESVYVLNELCMPNGVCVLVDSHKSYIAALILTDKSKASKFAKANGIDGEWPQFLENPAFQAKAAESLAATAKQHGKQPFECVKYVRVLNEEWTPENEVLTAAMKLKRRVVDLKYKAVIDELFKE